ncbi:hypothetical protein JXR93_04825 [bacterium]|nr:hypothetical protein [bacterium]
MEEKIVSTITKVGDMNEFGQVATHNDFSPFISFLWLLLWPLLIFLSYLFIKYTINRLEAKGFFNEDLSKTDISTEPIQK